MEKSLDKENQPEKLKVSSMDKSEFTFKIKKLFHSMPTSEDVRDLLVPSGVKNCAYPSKKFKKNEIFKFKFKLKDGYEVSLWFHLQDCNVTKSESYARICPVMRCIIIDENGQSYDLIKEGKKVYWLESNKLTCISMNLSEDEREKLKNASHLPLSKLNTKM